jgi:hypothetical protein
MMHDRTFLARLCVDIDGVNMLVVFSRRRGCWESSCIRSSCANACCHTCDIFLRWKASWDIQWKVSWDIQWKVSWDIHWKVSCGTFTFQKCQKMTIGNLPPQKIPLAENRCLQEGKWNWKYKGKFQAVLYRLHITQLEVLQNSNCDYKLCLLVAIIWSGGIIIFFLPSGILYINSRSLCVRASIWHDNSAF